MIGVLRAEAAKCIHGFDDLVCPESHEAAGEVEAVLRAFESIAALPLAEKQQAVTDGSLSALRAFASLAPGERTAGRACETLASVKVPDLRKADQKPLKEDAKRLLAQATACAQYERVQELCPQVVAAGAAWWTSATRELKLERSYLDNDDLIDRALEAVTCHPEVARDYAGRFRLVMIDEFQDTDEKQLRLISLLSGEGACHLTTVGDAQQSIYRFRGGDVEVFQARGRGLPASSIMWRWTSTTAPTTTCLASSSGCAATRGSWGTSSSLPAMRQEPAATWRATSDGSRAVPHPPGGGQRAATPSS